MNISGDYLHGMMARWLPGAMYPSEVIWLTEQVVRHRIEVLIECGRQDGVSTRGLGELLGAHGVAIFSIDFDDDRERLQKVQESLSGLNVTCVSGDIHQQVPLLLNQHRGRRIGVVQDGPKGWEGLATLAASAFSDDVVLIAQHNLHKGQRSRAYFSLMACNPPFLEYDMTATQSHELRAREMQREEFRESNRPIDHSSLGICSLDGHVRPAVLENIRELDRQMRPWSAISTFQAWQVGQYDFVSKLRKKQPRSLYRFKPR